MGKERMNILVTDDSVTMRQLLKMVLGRQFSCTVTEAQDGQEAYEKLTAGSFDLLVTDINMPRLNGLELVEKVRREAALALPIIIVTTKGAEADRDKGMALGANAYVTKPVNSTHLAEAVRSVLG